MDPLSSFLIVMVSRFVLITLTERKVAMAKLNDWSTKLDSLKAFVYDTLTSFGIVTIVKAAMVPPMLCVRAGT